tara:strand:+ start:186 stop:950 length:765 start_codon:yes stop_codon:yes gene_type:complete
MTRARYQEIKRVINVAMPTPEQNAADKLAKVRPFLDLVNAKCKQLYIPKENLGLDESQILCCSRSARCSHRGTKTKKPLKNYINVYAIHEAFTGYCCTFKIDERKANEKDSVKKVLVEMTSKLPPRPYKIAVDRHYNSVDNAKLLLNKNKYLYGTLRTDRGLPKDLAARAKTELKERGDWVWDMAPPSLFVTIWKDTIDTVFLSTFHTPTSSTVERRIRGQASAVVTCPQVAKDYNKHMGACDQCNSLRMKFEQ